eukprot:252011_1
MTTDKLVQLLVLCTYCSLTLTHDTVSNSHISSFPIIKTNKTFLFNPLCISSIEITYDNTTNNTLHQLQNPTSISFPIIHTQNKTNKYIITYHIFLTNNCNQTNPNHFTAPSYLLSTIPNEALDYGFGQIIPYQILYNSNANNSEIQEIINTLGDAILTVFSNNGFDQQQNNIIISTDAYSIIHNHAGDMVVRWGQAFFEKDKDSVVSLTNSSEYAIQINEYFESSTVQIVKTSTVFVLINEAYFYYIYTEEESIWNTSVGTAIAVILIVFVLAAIIFAGTLLHCRKRRQNFETQLPKSKAHKQRVLYLEHNKQQKKQQRKEIVQRYKSKYGNIFKYKTIRQDTMDDEENENESENEKK